MSTGRPSMLVGVPLLTPKTTSTDAMLLRPLATVKRFSQATDDEGTLLKPMWFSKVPSSSKYCFEHAGVGGQVVPAEVNTPPCLRQPWAFTFDTHVPAALPHAPGCGHGPQARWLASGTPPPAVHAAGWRFWQVPSSKQQP